MTLKTDFFSKVLILSPHTDDGEFGCGGSIARFVSEGKEIYYVAFSTAEKSVPSGYPKNILEKEVRKATATLGIPAKNLIIYKYEVRKLNYIRQEILEQLVKIQREIQPDIIFLPSINDLHQDHYTVSIEGIRAFKNSTILGYELLWNNISFNTQAFIKLQKDHVEIKANALLAYKSQRFRSYVRKDFVYSWAKTRGVQIKADFAEAFEVVRWIV